MAEVIVLGAGPAGLMAALSAAGAGHACTVLEASDRIGGMSGSFDVAGQRVDYGSHRLHPAAPETVLRLVRELLGDDLQERPRAGRLRLADRWVGFPLRTTELLRTLPPSLSGRLATDAAATAARGLLPGATPEDFAAEITSRLGSTVLDRFYGPYARKLYGLDPRELDGELARRRVSAGSPLTIARRLISAGASRGGMFLYPRRGYGQIVERLAEAAVEAGVDIIRSRPATKVRVDSDRVAVASADRTIDAAAVLSTIPAVRLASALEPAPPEDVVDALHRRRVRAMLLVYLVLDRPQYTPFDAHYLPGPDTTVARLSEPKNYRDGDDPADRTVLCAEIACDPGDDLMTLPAMELGAMVADDLARVDLPRVEPVEVTTRVLPSVYPVLDLAGRADRALIDRWAGGIDRVLSLGRQGLSVLDNLHHVLAMGSAAAECLGPDGTIRTDRWHLHLSTFAENTVED